MTRTPPRTPHHPALTSALVRLAAVAGLVVTALLLPQSVLAQSVSDPRLVEFFPSPDHNRTLSGGQAMVTGYAFEVYAAGGSSPVQTIQMGKPALSTDGLLRYDFSANTGWAVQGTVYESRIAVTGPQGTTRSMLSNSFTFGASGCAYSLSSGAASVPAAGGTSSVSVATATGCAWTATSSAGWLVPAVGSGSGSGSVSYTVAVNSGAARVGTLTIAGLTLTVSQSAAATPPRAPTNLRLVP